MDPSIYGAEAESTPPGPRPLGPEQALPLREIRSSGRWSAARFADLWQYRELFYFLALRDVKIRYKQAIIGAGWAVIQPIFMVAVFWIFLGKLAHVGSEGLPYAVFAFSGLIPWLFFANSVAASSDSLVNNPNLISKVYCPRLVIPLASVLSWIPDVFIALVVLIGLMALYGIPPAVTMVFLPLFIVLGLLTAIAAGVWLSALNVAYRDIRYVVPFFLQLGLFLAPVTYPATLIGSSTLRLLFGLNPMTGVVEGFRWAVLARGPAPWSSVGESIATAVIVLVTGLIYFRRVEQFFADII
jgi:lipopolysaccharide transport system permease protein